MYSPSCSGANDAITARILRTESGGRRRTKSSVAVGVLHGFYQMEMSSPASPLTGPDPTRDDLGIDGHLMKHSDHSCSRGEAWTTGCVVCDALGATARCEHL